MEDLVESTRFDRLTRQWSAHVPRRPLFGAMLGGVLGISALGAPDATAKRKKKVTLCLNGATLSVKKSKKGSLLSQGATQGACPASPPPPPGGDGCAAGTKPCNGACIAANACCSNDDCDPCLREVCVDGQCACPGGMARDAQGVCSIFRSCATAFQTTPAGTCCSGIQVPLQFGLVLCQPGTNTCATDIDCVHGHRCVGNLCAPVYIATVGEQCAARAFNICSERVQCRSGRCEDGFCKTCTTNEECRREVDPAGSCFCEDSICLRRSSTPLVDSCSECPANTEHCRPANNRYVCYPACGSR